MGLLIQGTVRQEHLSGPFSVSAASAAATIARAIERANSGGHESLDVAIAAKRDGEPDNWSRGGAHDHTAVVAGVVVREVEGLHTSSFSWLRRIGVVPLRSHLCSPQPRPLCGTDA